jgi:glyoxylase-like metal-dependent hydrolase (beta-lactamase superfamily II)
MPMLNRRHLLGRSLALGAAAAATACSPARTPMATAPAPGTPSPVVPAPGFRRLSVGSVEVLALADGVARRPLGEEFVRNAPIAEVRALLASQNLPTDTIDIPFTPFVVVMGNRRILMDTGLGEFGGATTGKLLDNLRAAGLQPGDIDTVLISHYHGDHINGLRNKAGEFVFSKAKVMVPQPEHGFWMDDARMAAAPEAQKGAFNNVRRTFAQMPAGMLVPFQPGTEVLPGIRSVAAFGHTPGHTLFELSSGNQSFTYVADLTNVPSLFARQPDWAVQFDMDAEAARQVRRATFERIIASNSLIGGFHFPYPAFGRMVRAGNGFAFQPVI